MGKARNPTPTYKTYRDEKRMEATAAMLEAAQRARAFAGLCATLGRKIDRVLDADDSQPETARVLLAIRTALDGPALGHVFHCTRLAEMAAKSRLEEPDHVAGHLAAAAEQLAAVIEALAVELDACDAEIQLRKLRRARRAA